MRRALFSVSLPIGMSQLRNLSAVTSSPAPPSPSSSTTSSNTAMYKSTRVGSGVSKSSKGGPGTFSSCAEDVGPVESRPLTALQRRQLAMKDKMVFLLTPNAVYRVKHLMQVQVAADPSRPPVGIRIAVKKRGCSGYSYTVNYEYSDSPKKEGDNVVEQTGVKIFVDGDALFYVIGTHMDYITTNVEEKFTFANPNQKHKCGCGESFMPFDV
jgi:iron-sulfur cluster assembly accessory protein